MKTNSYETGLIAHYFNNADIANVGDATGLRGSTAAGSLYVSGHTAFPGEAGAQNTSECAYTGYVRQASARSGSGWTCSTNSATNAALIQFGQKTAGADETIFFAGVGRSSSGAGTLDYIAPLASDRALFTAATSDTITVPGVSLVVDDRITFFDLVESDFPAGITAGTVYFVKTVSGNDITISATSGGATIDVTSAGSGIAFKMAGLLVSNGVNPQIAIGALNILEF